MQRCKEAGRNDRPRRKARNNLSAGFAQWKKTVVEGSGRLAGAWSSTAAEIPDTLIGEGDEVALILYVGTPTANRFYSFNAVIENLEVVCNQTNDVVRFSATFKSTGVITDPSA